MQELKGKEFLLDGYITLNNPKNITISGSNYSLQCYQGDHEDEYLLMKDRRVCLFQNGVMKMCYEIDKEGNQIGDFTRFENGRVAFVQSFDDIMDNRDSVRMVNHMKGERMEIYSHATGKLTYHGEFNEQREREGWGIQYDEKSGRMLLEGMWKGNKLVEIIRKFEEGSIMTEFKRNGNNTIVSNRIPVYVGGFVYEEEKESFIRNGRGYLIDEETRIATRECEWKDGMEVSGRDLYDGWYKKPKHVKINVSESMKLNSVSLQVTDLMISSDCCNDLDELDLNRFEWLRSIEIGDMCFAKVKTFKIDGLNRLKTLKIGSKSFIERRDGRIYGDNSKSFHILNCESLKSIQIGEYSFCDNAGEFELKNLPQLQSIQIGTIESYSCNFYYSSFVIRSIELILNIE